MMIMNIKIQAIFIKCLKHLLIILTNEILNGLLGQKRTNIDTVFKAEGDKYHLKNVKFNQCIALKMLILYREWFRIINKNKTCIVNLG